MPTEKQSRDITSTWFTPLEDQTPAAEESPSTPGTVVSGDSTTLLVYGIYHPNETPPPAPAGVLRTGSGIVTFEPQSSAAETDSSTPVTGFTTAIAGTAGALNFTYTGAISGVVAAAGANGPWLPSLINFRPVSAKEHRALVLKRIMDAELPRYAEALKRLGEWNT